MRQLLAALTLVVTIPAAAQPQGEARLELLDFKPLMTETAQLSARGVVKAQQQAVLAAQMDGRIISNHVTPGQHFKAGEVLIKQDCTVREIALRKSRVELKARQTQHKLNVALKKRRAISDTEVEISHLEVEAAQSEVAGIRAEIDRCSIRAPFDGLATKLWRQTHETVKGGDEVITVVSDQAYEFELYVPSRWLRWLTTGTAFNIEIEELGTSFAAEVTSIGPAVDAGSQTIDIRGRLLASDEELAPLLPGMSGTARFEKVGPDKE